MLMTFAGCAPEPSARSKRPSFAPSTQPSASLQLAAAAANLVAVEYDPFGNPLLDELSPGFPELTGGKIQVPHGNGLGLDVDMRFVKKNLDE